VRIVTLIALINNCGRVSYSPQQAGSWAHRRVSEARTRNPHGHRGDLHLHGRTVARRTLARNNRENLSAASIRNVMADLADAGFLDQPHTSAGRVPTTQAYRFYVKHLTGEARLSPADESLIQGSLHGTQDVQEFMERTSHVLSPELARRGARASSAAEQQPKRAGAWSTSSAWRQESFSPSSSCATDWCADRVLRLTNDLTASDLDIAAA